MEGDPEHCVDPKSMAHLGVNPVDSESGGDRISKKIEAEDDLLGLGHQKEKTVVIEKSVEMGVCEKIHLEGAVSAGDGPDGKLGCLIEEKLGKVSLIGEGNDGIGMKVDETVGDKDESDDDSEDESSSSSSSPSSSSDSSSSDEEDDEDNEATRGEKKAENEEQTDLEDGEIMLSDTEGLVGWSDNDDAEDESAMTGPIKSKNELTVLPPVPSVDVTLEPHHQTLPVGVILSIVGAQVIVEGVEKHNPLSEGSILWNTESRLPLGIIDEIFGPVKNPYYIVRYNSESEVPAGIEQGTLISFVQEFANHVLNDKSLYQKGYDASNEYDEELSDELEFSDDEKEAEYRKMIKMKKRGKANESKAGNKRNEKKQQTNRNGSWNNNRGPASQSPLSAHNQHSGPPNAAMINQDNSLRSSGPTQGSPFPHGPQVPGLASGPRPDLTGNQAMVSPFPQGPGFVPPNGIWNNGFPQQQNMGLPSGLPGNGMLWMQQNGPSQLFQTPLQMNMAFQQQIGPIPGFPLNFNNGFGGQPNFAGGPMLTPWPTNPAQLPTNPAQFGMVLQGQHAPRPMSDGGGEQSSQPNFAGGPMLTTPWPTNPAQFGMGLQGQHAPRPMSDVGGEQSSQPNFAGGPMLTTPWPTNPAQFGMGLQGQHAPRPMSDVGGEQSSQPNFAGGPMLTTPWPTNPVQFGMGLQGQHAPRPMSDGGGEQGSQQSQGPQNNCNSQPSLEHSNFSKGRGGGGGRRGHNRGRGRSGGGRGRFQSR